MPAMITMKNMEIKRIMTNQVHLVMMRYTLDNSPLDEAEEYSEMVRYVFADREKAQLMADELEGAYGGLDSYYFVATHSVVS
jgi:hypothetical protein